MELCGSFRLPRFSPRDSVGFRPTAQFVFRHVPSRTRFCRLEQFSLQDRCLPLAGTARCAQKCCRRRHWPSVRRDVVFLHKAAPCRKSSIRKWQKCTFLRSARISPSLFRNKQVTSMSRWIALPRFGTSVVDTGLFDWYVPLLVHRNGAPLPNLSNRLRRSRAAKLALTRGKPSTSMVELPSWHSEGGGFSGTALGSGPQKPECIVTFPWCPARLGCSPAGGCRCVLAWCSSPGVFLVLAFRLFSGRRPKERSLSVPTPAGRTSDQTQGQRPKNRLFSGTPFRFVKLVFWVSFSSTSFLVVQAFVILVLDLPHLRAQIDCGHLPTNSQTGTSSLFAPSASVARKYYCPFQPQRRSLIVMSRETLLRLDGTSSLLSPNASVGGCRSALRHRAQLTWKVQTRRVPTFPRLNIITSRDSTLWTPDTGQTFPLRGSVVPAKSRQMIMKRDIYIRKNL